MIFLAPQVPGQVLSAMLPLRVLKIFIELFGCYVRLTVFFQPQFECECYPGYHGIQCEEQEDLCRSDPCQNANACSTVIDDNNRTATYICLCISGWEGKNCSKRVDFCEEQEVTCSGNGECENFQDYFRCNCSSGRPMFGILEKIIISLLDRKFIMDHGR